MGGGIFFILVLIFVARLFILLYHIYNGNPDSKDSKHDELMKAEKQEENMTLLPHPVTG